MENRKSSFAVIPSYILCDEDIEHGAARLYGMISMYSEEGRCWASNQHFADKFKVTIRTIQLWLQQLVDKQYIEVEIIKGGFQTKRNIWITNDFKKHSTKRNTFHPDVNSISPPHDMDFTSYNVTNINDTNIKQLQQKAAETSKSYDCSSSSSISKEKENLMRTHSIEESYWKTISFYSTSQIEYAIKCALSWLESLQNRGEVLAPLGSAVVRALKENWKLPENPPQNNQVHSSELMKDYVKNLDLEDRISIDFGATYAQITVNGSAHAYTFLYEDKKSLEMFKHQVNKFKRINELGT